MLKDIKCQQSVHSMSDNLTCLSVYYGDLFGQKLMQCLKGGLNCSPAELFTHRTLKGYIFVHETDLYIVFVYWWL